MQVTPQLHHRQGVPSVVWGATAVATGSIWLAVIVASLVAPDFVSGSQHQHLQLVAGTDWIWGLVATALVILAVREGFHFCVTAATPWVALGVGMAAVWAFVLLVTAFAPVFVTGSDPTTVPMAALGVPILGMFLTWFVCTLVRTSFQQES